MNNLKRIGLIEPFDHSEVVYALCEMLIEQEVEIHVYCSEYIADECPQQLKSHKKIQWSTFTGSNRKVFFTNHQENLQDCQLLLWITAAPSSYRWIYHLDLHVPFVLIIHNLHTWLAPWQYLQLDFSTASSAFIDILRLLRFAFWQRPYQKKLLKQATAVGFPSPPLLDLARQLGCVKKSVLVPFFHSIAHSHTFIDEKEICIIIPGSVTQNGRDYQGVAEAFQAALPKIEKNVNLILLGAIKEQKPIQLLKTLENERFTLISFPERISQNNYYNYLRKAHFLILPFASSQKFGIIREKWGRSKISGGISDMVYHRIPGLCSASYYLENPLLELVENYYSIEELTTLLIDWINCATYKKYALSEEKYDKLQQSNQLYHQLSTLVRSN